MIKEPFVPSYLWYCNLFVCLYRLRINPIIIIITIMKRNHKHFCCLQFWMHLNASPGADNHCAKEFYAYKYTMRQHFVKRIELFVFSIFFPICQFNISLPSLRFQSLKIDETFASMWNIRNNKLHSSLL